MSYFEDKVMNINNHLSLYLHTILEEAKLTYENDLADPYFTELKLNPTAPKFSQDLIAISLEAFLIELIRAQLNQSNNTSISIHEKENNRRVQKVIDYLESNITNNITLEDICTHCSMSRSLIQKLFKDDTGWSVMEYFYRLKIEEAKRLIRNGTNNFTQIADHLGYSTIHYFSRQFKKIVGMSPSEYSKSILNLAQEERYKQF
jgi:AraC-like DNA-binding protein